MTDFDGEALMAMERERRQNLLESFGMDRVAGRLALAADQFVVNRTVAGTPVKTIERCYLPESFWPSIPAFSSSPQPGPSAFVSAPQSRREQFGRAGVGVEGRQH